MRSLRAANWALRFALFIIADAAATDAFAAEPAAPSKLGYKSLGTDNWLAYNFAHDVQLPCANHPKLGFFMYPQAQVASLLLDCLDPDSMQYTITSTPVTAA